MQRNERGAATVELALSIPLLVVMMMLLAQVAGVLVAQLAVQEAARAGARAAAVQPDSGAATRAAKAATGLSERKLQINTQVARADGLVRVEVGFPVELRMPMTNTLLITKVVRSTVAMPLEYAG